MLALQIALGIWLGGLLLIGSVAAYFAVAQRIERNRRYGYAWYSWGR